MTNEATPTSKSAAESAESLDGGNLSTSILRSHLRWIEENEPEWLDGIKALLSPETARSISALDDGSGWVPFRVVVELDRAIASLAGKDERVVSAELGRHSARLNLPRQTQGTARERPHDFFTAIALHHTRFQDFGRAAYDRLASTAGRITISEVRCFSKIYCWTAIGYFETAAGLCGGGAAHADETSCVCTGGDACRFEISWI